MLDRLEEIEKFSPFGGQQILEEVKGSNNQFVTAENSVYAKTGTDRSMYSYVPQSGCPDAKQCQVLMVLRKGSDKQSAEDLMKELKLNSLAEERHFILLFPNPQSGGWNYKKDPSRDDDQEFLIRCFAALPKSKGGVAGFNGMIFYIAACPEASALLALMSAEHPLDSSALMLGKFPDDFKAPSHGHFQTAWIYQNNTDCLDYLKKVNIPWTKETEEYHNTENPQIRFFMTDHELNANEVYEAWEKMFSEARRWRNDTFGHYQKRTNFEESGFTAHVKDSSLGVNNDFAHTWYEYIPESISNSSEKVPLLFYFHGGNCIPLYGAEQSDWHRLADREKFIVVYPRASKDKVWNVWDDETGPSDFAFVLALIQHMKTVHPIDESRIYLSGFSMGSMMTNALCCAYPEIFAGGAGFHAQNYGYLKTREETFSHLHGDGDAAGHTRISRTHALSDEKKAEYDYRVPFLQGTGLLDNLGRNSWPIKSEDNDWLETIDFWKKFNNIPLKKFTYSDKFETGLSGDESYYDGTDERFIHHVWHTADASHLPLYQFLVAKRMPHALDLRATAIAWEFLKHYSRGKDGKLIYQESVK